MLTPHPIRKSPDLFKADDGQEWFADLRRRARASTNGPIAEVTILTPSRAQVLLDVNPDNRPISQATVDTYAADILAGRWQFNGEPIIISDTGQLNDGSHRCAGVIHAGQAIPVLVVCGVPRASRTTTDMGKPRTVGDFVSMHGIPDANNVAAIAGIVHALEGPGISGARGATSNIHKHNARPTKAEILTFARANIDDIQKAIHNISRLHSGKICSYTRLCGMACVLARKSKDWDAVIDFMTDLVDGVGLTSRNPIYVGREKLIEERAKGTLSPLRTFETLIKAWNAHRLGRQIGSIKLMNALPDIEV